MIWGTPISENLHMGESIPTYPFFSMEMGQKPFKTYYIEFTIRIVGIKIGDGSRFKAYIYSTNHLIIGVPNFDPYGK